MNTGLWLPGELAAGAAGGGNLAQTHTDTHTHTPKSVKKNEEREYMLPSSFPQNKLPPYALIFLNPFCRDQKSSTNPTVSLPNILKRTLAT